MERAIDSKLPDVGTTIFTVMSQLADETDAINLSQGFPSFEPPEALTERIAHHLKNGANQYAPMTGVPALLEVIADKTRRFQGRQLDPQTTITVSCGATEGLFSAIQALVRPGDEVIVFDPAYDAYEPAITLAGGVTQHIPLLIDNADFTIDWNCLEDSLNDRTRLIILNFPHNPTGAVLSKDDLEQLATLTRNTETLLLADEVYEHIVFDGESHHSLLQHDELWERSLVISSFGKTLHATGWKIGYCIAPERLSTEFRKVHQFATFAISTPVQHGIADFLSNDLSFCDSLATFYQQKRDFFCQQLSSSRFRFQPARSTFFQILDYGEISPESDLELAKSWTRDVGVASIPLSAFCKAPDATVTRLRFCFAKDDTTLQQAAERLAAL